MSAEPLNVRVARALHPDATFERHERQHATTCPYSSQAAARGNSVADCNCIEDAYIWWMTTRSVDSEWRSASHVIVPPYGEDTPEGWACTGPLSTRFEIGYYLVAAGWRAECVWPTGALGLAGRCFYSRAQADPEQRLCWPSPCEAIARVVLALAEAGRLTP